MKILTTLTLVAILTLISCSGEAQPAPSAVPVSGLAKATFAGGCFWCMEPPFEKLPGVVSVISGYTGGRTESPSYEAVSYGATGHYEAVEILYDPRKVSYAKLLEVFWRNIDPTNNRGQFCDNGDQYLAAIFFRDESERKLAEQTKAEVARTKNINVVTKILAATRFHAAEEYHQDYYKKNPARYKFYRFNCGRDQRLEKIWGKARSH